VLANGRCDVLKGQCLRSNAGLFYEGYGEFVETLQTLEHTPSLVAALGVNGRSYFDRHYAWPIIERKYLAMFDRLRREPAEESWPARARGGCRRGVSGAAGPFRPRAP